MEKTMLWTMVWLPPVQSLAERPVLMKALGYLSVALKTLLLEEPLGDTQVWWCRNPGSSQYLSTFSLATAVSIYMSELSLASCKSLRLQQGKPLLILGLQSPDVYSRSTEAWWRSLWPTTKTFSQDAWALCGQHKLSAVVCYWIHVPRKA